VEEASYRMYDETRRRAGTPRQDAEGWKPNPPSPIVSPKAALPGGFAFLGWLGGFVRPDAPSWHEMLDAFRVRGKVDRRSTASGRVRAGSLPSDHPCSSQFFAVNFLFLVMHRPEAFADLLRKNLPGLARMFPIGEEAFFAFEWIGHDNYLGEVP